MPRTLLSIFFVLFAAARIFGASLDSLAPHTSGIWLVQVVKFVNYDDRPADGNKGVRIKLRGVRGSGQFNDELDIITDFGGARPPGFDNPELPKLIRPDSLQLGKQYWIAFASIHDLEEHPQWVINFWPKGNEANEMVFEEAVRDDILCWSPRYDPVTKLSYGRKVLPVAEVSEKKWRIRVERAGRVLWEKDVPGTISQDYFAWTLDKYAATNFPDIKLPSCRKLLVAETATQLHKENEYGLHPGMVYIRTGYDPETGMRLSDRIRKHQDGDSLLLERSYDPGTGKVAKEVRP